MKNIPSYGTIKSYLFGYVSCIALTLLAYLLVTDHVFRQDVLLPIVVILGLVQVFLQLVLFLHLGKESKPRWNLLMFFFMIAVLIIVVFGSLWIMHYLNYNMMPQM